MVDQMQLTQNCPVCGTARRPGAKFCGLCGTLVDPAGSVDLMEEAPTAVQGTAATLAMERPQPLGPGILRLGAFVLIGAGVLVSWFLTVADNPPGFANVLDLKISAATLVLILTILQLLSASVFYGWLRVPWPPGEAAAFIHRWSGRVLLPAAAVVTVYCIKDIGPQSSPTRLAIHSTLGSIVFVVVAAKLIILRAAPRLSGLIPVLGAVVAACFVGLWFSSAFHVLRTRASGYTGGDVGARISIVSDPNTIGRFDPITVKVRVEQVVQWTNTSNAPHSVVREGGGFDSGVIAQGSTFLWPAKKAGSVTYRCSIHPNMPVATIIVQDK